MKQIRRRQLLVAMAGLTAHSLSAFAQAGRRVRRIGYLSQANVQVNAPRLAAFRAGMLKLRWTDQRDYLIDARYANGITQDLPALAAELVAARPDLLLVPSDEDVRLLAQRTRTIPIVFAITQDPVGNGLALSLRHPGGNATGLTSLASELSAKRLQLLKEAVPQVAHVAVLFEPDNVGSVSQVREIEDAAPRLGMRVTRIELRQPADVDPAFDTITLQRQAIPDRIIGLKLPSMFASGLYVEAGGLMSYSTSFTENFRRAATCVDKILKGADPGNLPIEQPTKFELL